MTGIFRKGNKIYEYQEVEQKVKNGQGWTEPLQEVKVLRRLRFKIMMMKYSNTDKIEEHPVICDQLNERLSFQGRTRRNVANDTETLSP